MRVLDFDPEFMWDEGELFPATLIERGRLHAIHNTDQHPIVASVTFAGVASCWNPPGDWRGISFVVLGCAICGQEIGRGIVWRTPPMGSVYPWQEGYWARVERGVA